MKPQTLLLDDYGMFLLRGLYESWDDLLAMQPYSSSMTLEKEAHIRAGNQEINVLFNNLIDHLILLLEHPDIPLRRDDEQHLTLDQNIVEILAKHSKHRNDLRHVYTVEASHGVMGTWGQLFNSIEAFWDDHPVIFHL